MVKDAGMKYITITSKHHDGFAMWGTKQSDWDIVDRSPYHKDALKMLADECHKQGVKLFFYHSQLDWHNPNYFPLGRTGRTTGRPEGGEWNKYLDYMDNQLRELLTATADRRWHLVRRHVDKPEPIGASRNRTRDSQLQPARAGGSVIISRSWLSM